MQRAGNKQTSNGNQCHFCRSNSTPNVVLRTTLLRSTCELLLSPLSAPFAEGFLPGVAGAARGRASEEKRLTEKKKGRENEEDAAGLDLATILFRVRKGSYANADQYLADVQKIADEAAAVGGFEHAITMAGDTLLALAKKCLNHAQSTHRVNLREVPSKGDATFRSMVSIYDRNVLWETVESEAVDKRRARVARRARSLAEWAESVQRSRSSGDGERKGTHYEVATPGDRRGRVELLMSAMDVDVSSAVEPASAALLSLGTETFLPSSSLVHSDPLKALLEEQSYLLRRSLETQSRIIHYLKQNPYAGQRALGPDEDESVLVLGEGNPLLEAREANKDLKARLRQAEEEVRALKEQAAAAGGSSSAQGETSGGGAGEAC